MADMKQLTGVQQAALVLLNMDDSAAQKVMQQFSETEAEEITAEIFRLRNADPDSVAEALERFSELHESGVVKTSGGRDAASALLSGAFGEERAAGLMDRVTNGLAGKAFEFLDSADPKQVAFLLDGEMPQLIALIIAHLKDRVASPIFAALRPDVRTSVAQAIATMTPARPEAVRIIADTLRARAGAMVDSKGQNEVVGGVQPLVDIINRSDVATEKALLEDLDNRDPELAEAVRARLLTFEDLIKFEAGDVQKVLRGVDMAVLALAMKGTPEALQEFIKGNLSERNRDALQEEADLVGAVKASKVEEARSDIVRSIRTLEAEGEITIQRGDGEDLVQ